MFAQLKEIVSMYLTRTHDASDHSNLSIGVFKNYSLHAYQLSIYYPDRVSHKLCIYTWHHISHKLLAIDNYGKVGVAGLEGNLTTVHCAL